jgi:hypothetical protein
MKRDPITQEKLKAVLDYNPDTGIFVRKKNSGPAKKGDIAGSLGRDGYLVVRIFGERYLAHRLVWLWANGYLPEHEIDHINRKRDDNRLKNLRHVSRQCNSRNKAATKRNKSGVTGVIWHKRDKVWFSYICVAYKTINLGYFENKKDAVKKRFAAEQKYGFHKCLSDSTAYQYLKTQHDRN